MVNSKGAVALISLVVGVAGCKKLPNRVGTTPKLLTPASVEAASGAGLDWGVVVISETGLPKTPLLLVLDYFPEGEKQPWCAPFLQPSFGPVGFLVCQDDPDLSFEVLPQHIAQKCFSAPPGYEQRKRESLELKGCRSGRLWGVPTSPQLKVIQARLGDS